MRATASERGRPAAGLLARRTFVVGAVLAAIVVTLAAAWTVRTVLLLAFAAWLLALMLGGGARWLSAHTRIPHGPAVLVVTVALLALMTGVVVLMAADLASEVGTLSERLPAALERLRSRLERMGLPLAPPGGREMARRAAGVFSHAVGALGAAAFVLFLGTFFAADPEPYRRGVLALMPRKDRPAVKRATEEASVTVERWMVARLISMVVVAVATGGGLAALGIPAPVTLGLLAGLLDFVPNFGPLLASLPALVLAAEEGTRRLALVAGLYITVQTLESYVLAPLLEKRAVHLPPGFLLLGQAVFGYLLGPLGLVFATPLLAAAVVIATELRGDAE